jgi:hypothetical protein
MPQETSADTTRSDPRGRRRGPASPPGWNRWLGEPRAAVLIVMLLIVVIGAGRKLLRGLRARGLVHRLGEPDVSAEEVAAAVEYGREGLMEFFRILGTAESAGLRTAAGQALATLWARDDLIAEEEQALVRRGFSVSWRARRRYPRALRGAIPIAVEYGVPFLHDDGPGISPANLEWSHAILGARRAALETPSPWKAGPGHAEFTLFPGDFDTNGPHRLVLKARVRTAGLTGSWELDLPQMPLSFEFDPALAVDALFTLPDTARGEAIAHAVRLVQVAGQAEEGQAARFLDLNPELALRNPPDVAVETPLPCDLAHAIGLEFEGIEGRFAAGEVLLSGQGLRTDGAGASVRTFPLGPVAPIPLDQLDHPGRRRMRAHLSPDADRGWADPEVRSIWPEPIVTDWVEVEVVRR